MSPSGADDSFDNFVESYGQTDLATSIEELTSAPPLKPIPYKPSPESIGTISADSLAFYEATKEMQRSESPKEPEMRKTHFTRLTSPKPPLVPKNPYLGKDYETINEMLHTAYGYQSGGFFAKENFNIREAKKDLIYLKGIKKGELEEDPDNFMIGLWVKKIKATLKRDEVVEYSDNDSEDM